jgi:UDP-N-acetylmuramyl tripeptide synthase
MRLGALTGGGEPAEVTGFAIDHRKVAPGTIFGAFQGARFNGEDFIPAAIAAGAVAVVARPEARVEGAAHVASAEPRRDFARLAARFFRPFPKTVVAVTGTNGKTSNVELTRQLWRMAGHPSASIGTLGVTTSDEQVTTGLTTPDIVTFLSNMAGLAKMGITHAAFEASSHGLDQYRTEGLPVQAAAFTNFSRDHLDYHGTMEAYFAAKMRLFEEVVDADGAAVVWTDDPRSGEVIARANRRGLKLLTVGSSGEALQPDHRRGGAAAQSGSGADRSLPGGERADRRRPRHRDGRRRRADIAQPVARAPGAWPAGAGGDHARRRARLCRLRPHARRDRGGDRGASAAHDRAADHRLRRRRRPRPGQEGGDGRGGGAAVGLRHHYRRQSQERGPRRHTSRHPGWRA